MVVNMPHGTSGRIAFFDFCETLVDFQTANSFVDFVRESYGGRKMHVMEVSFRLFAKSRLFKIIEILFCCEFSVGKCWKLLQLKGLKKQYLEDMAYRYYKERICPHLIPQTIAELKRRQQEGFSICIVSGGYDIYLKFFVEEYAINYCLSSNVRFVNDICTGTMEGPDCMGRQKKNMIVQYFKTERFDDSISYSDNVSDVPLLSLTGTGIVVSKKDHQDWINNYNYTEIIWE